MARKKTKKKEFANTWIFEAFDRDPSFAQKRMFGGLSAYVFGRMVMVLTESPGEREWRGKEYDIDLWNGVLLPTYHEHHSALMKEFKGLVSHPVLGKWLYLPEAHDDFEDLVMKLAYAIAEDDPRFGIEPSIKERKKRKKKSGR